MKLAINILLSLIMLAICVWLVWPDAEQQKHIEQAARALNFADFAPYLVGHLALVGVTHFCRAWRWNNLLHPIGVWLSPGRLLATSSVGFMAILALPARLGEFVRPALIRKKGEISAAAALGTIAIERIIDGLLVSLFVFGALFALRAPGSPTWMMPTAYAALGIFSVALVFLAFALRWPKKTVHFWVDLSMIRFVSERVAGKLEEKLLELISGFLVLKDKRNLIIFTLWSITYWGANGMSLWLLARGFGLDLSVLGAFATMGLVAVGITLPNSPGLVGQYQYFTLLGLGLYLDLGNEEIKASAFVFAVALHGIQVIWYLSMGAIAMSSKHVTFAEVAAARSLGENEDDASSTQPA
ncbi:MAG: flippase-like domain-containing protein [Myxococcales bacterium]|nr:flippase-like domain-containing protein [Myxococcales bacterium]